MGFTIFGLSDQVLQGVHASGYTVPTAIQALVLRPATEGRDIIGSAQTGTGKTAAFVLPMLHRLSTLNGSTKHTHPRALVLTPTRELAQQVQDAVTTYGKFLRLRSGSIYGGVGMEGQIKMLRRGVDIIIATPGRLLDHMQRRTIDLSQIQILVLDEADRMLGMGFIDDVRKIVAKVPKDRQTMLFSATISSEVNSLASQILRDPHSVEAGHHRKPVEAIKQNFYQIQTASKMDLLHHVLKSEKLESVLIFSRTKRGADKISDRLEKSGITSTAIHSNRTQPQRMRALEGFRKGKYRVLVATDIAARGIDVDGISHVINYDIPRDAEDYVHRVGRTGRAGASGDAITFVSGEDREMLRKIERFTGKRFTASPYEGFIAPERSAAPAHAPKHSSSHERSHSPKHSSSHERSHSPKHASSHQRSHGPRHASSQERSHSPRHASSQDRTHSPRHASSQDRTHSPMNASMQERTDAAYHGPYKKKGSHGQTAERPSANKKGKKRFVFAKKKKSVRQMGSFSSDSAAWSNR
jgi:ATP-dependent RNA helicase RhlE